MISQTLSKGCSKKDYNMNMFSMTNLINKKFTIKKTIINLISLTKLKKKFNPKLLILNTNIKKGQLQII